MSETIDARFFKDARDSQTPVSLYLVNGYQLKGDIIAFDERSILFKHKDFYQIVLRSAIASMYPFSKTKGHAETWWSKYS